MIYSIKIGGISRIGTGAVGGVDFDVSVPGGLDKVFSYCEINYGFNGEEWDEIKSEYDLEGLSELLEDRGIRCDMYDDE